MQHLIKRIAPVTLLVFALTACEEYGDLKPVLNVQINTLETTINGIRTSDTPAKTVIILRHFNEKMSVSYAEYLEARKKHPELEHLFKSPPSSLKAEVARIKNLSDTLRDTLIITSAHTGEPGMRRHLESTVVILDRIKSQ